ncbi:MAG: hypothetical protein AAFO94_23260, partial [Bacteroidota bacterium]
RVNGRWQPVRVNNLPYREERVFSFTTGPAPGYIDHSIVETAYPLINQFNFYKNQHNGANFVKLTIGRADLFDGTIYPANEYEIISRYVDDGSGAVIKEGVAYYAPSSKRLLIESASNLNNDRIYRLEVVAKPRNNSTLLANNVKTNYVQTATDIGTVVRRERKLKGNITDSEESIIYTVSFRTSKYNSFYDKMMAYSFGAAPTW